jgi:hypothetical protein
VIVFVVMIVIFFKCRGEMTYLILHTLSLLLFVKPCKWTSTGLLHTSPAICQASPSALPAF